MARNVTRVTVTRADVRNGKQGNVCLCPVALALTRADVRPGQMWVDEDYIKVYEPGVTWLAETPGKAADFIRAFDDEGPTRALLDVAEAGLLTFELDWEAVPDEAAP